MRIIVAILLCSLVYPAFANSSRDDQQEADIINIYWNQKIMADSIERLQLLTKAKEKDTQSQIKTTEQKNDKSRLQSSKLVTSGAMLFVWLSIVLFLGLHYAKQGNIWRQGFYRRWGITFLLIMYFGIWLASTLAHITNNI